MKILFSRSLNPYSNLACEQFLLEEGSHDLLFIWKNKPSVIIGRSQNPWQECVGSAISHDGIDVCRRHSGGGAVFHDEGNLNFTFYTQRTTFDRHTALFILQKSLENLGVYTELRERESLFWQGKKILGSAYRIEKRSCYHHVSLLLNVDSTTMWRYLRKDNHPFKSEGISSHVSPVAGVLEADASISEEKLIKSITTQWRQHSGDSSVSLQNINSDFKEENQQKKLSSWEWIFGKSPPFTITKQGFVVDIEKGRIISIKSSLDAESAETYTNLKQRKLFFTHSPPPLFHRRTAFL